MKKNEKKNNDLTIKINKTKLLKGLGVFAVVVLVLVVAFFASNDNGEAKVVNFTNITIDEYLERMKLDEKSIIYIARPTCSWCQKETPVVKKLMSQYDLKVYYLNTENFYDAEKEDYTEDGYKFINAAEPYKSKQSFGTPNTIIVEGGNIIDGKYGYVEAKELKDMLVSNGFINE